MHPKDNRMLTHPAPPSIPRTPCYQTCHVGARICSDCSDLPVNDLHSIQRLVGRLKA
ncbi:hypothetical protein BJX63DRAFT_186599 [Aspergillus granulosus]|uniref:Uncharacterized protein n=1 Tax=Aspergillus granulosus TaxID=176169 RepID=A0ABR4HHK3_9EURO